MKTRLAFQKINIVSILLLMVLSACSSPQALNSATTIPIPSASFSQPSNTQTPADPGLPTPQVLTQVPTAVPSATTVPFPLTIDAMRARAYPGSDMVMEKEFTPASNYRSFYASYLSDGLKIYGLLTIPKGPKPATGWPVIIFNHGYIPPNIYKTTERYVAYVDAIARSGYIVFKSDYRGHDQSQGVAQGAYGHPDYVVDVLNGLASVKRLPDADPNRIGMWGH